MEEGGRLGQAHTMHARPPCRARARATHRHMSYSHVPQSHGSRPPPCGQEGVRGFTAGLPQRALYISLGSAIFFSVFEAVHHALADATRDRLAT